MIAQRLDRTMEVSTVLICIEATPDMSVSATLPRDKSKDSEFTDAPSVEEDTFWHDFFYRNRTSETFGRYWGNPLSDMASKRLGNERIDINNAMDTMICLGAAFMKDACAFLLVAELMAQPRPLGDGWMKGRRGLGMLTLHKVEASFKRLVGADAAQPLLVKLRNPGYSKEEVRNDMRAVWANKVPHIPTIVDWYLRAHGGWKKFRDATMVEIGRAYGHYDERWMFFADFWATRVAML
ncbi:hypothetical protein OQA88_6657 [Cercophora sp. LCS_1]